MIYIESIYEIKPTIVVNTTSNNHKFITDDPILQELVDIFIRTLEININVYNLNAMYNNLSTLRIENKHSIRKILSRIITDYMINGEYYLYENIISILPLINKNIISKYIGISKEEYIVNLYHELLHMSSTIIDKYNKIAYSGFYQTNKYDNEEIGVALDDAYTEMLLYRLFNISKEYTSYEYEISITKIIEEIVSVDTMTNLYFNANLYDLVSILSKYSNKKDIINFILDLDEIYILQEHSKKNKSNIIRCHHRIINFITDIYFNKLKEDITLNNITREVYIDKINNCLNIINNLYIMLEIDSDKVKSSGYKKLLQKIKYLNEEILSMFNNKIYKLKKDS